MEKTNVPSQGLKKGLQVLLTIGVTAESLFVLLDKDRTLMLLGGTQFILALMIAYGVFKKE